MSYIMGKEAASRFALDVLSSFLWQDETADEEEMEQMAADVFGDKEISLKQYMSLNYPDTYKTLEKVPDDVLLFARGGTVTDCESVCEGMAALAEAPQFNTRHALSLKNAFKGCAALPENYPWIISLASITDIEQIRDIFADSSVTFAAFADVSLAVARKMRKSTLGAQMRCAVINGNYGSLKA